MNRNGFEGLDSLDAAAKTYIAPLPVAYDAELPGYKSMIEMMGGQGGHVNENLPKAQAVKDATMAYFINKTSTPVKLSFILTAPTILTTLKELFGI